MSVKKRIIMKYLISQRQSWNTIRLVESAKTNLCVTKNKKATDIKNKNTKSSLCNQKLVKIRLSF